MPFASIVAHRLVCLLLVQADRICGRWGRDSKPLAALPGALKALFLSIGLAVLPAKAQVGGQLGSDIFGVYALNVHGQIWRLDLRQVPGKPDALTGVLSAGWDPSGNRVQDPVTGYFSRRAGTVVLLRGSGAQPAMATEVYVGKYNRQGLSIQGTVHRLLAQSDFTSGVSDVGFSASRQLRQPFAARAPRLPPAPMPAVGSIRGPWTVNANGYRLNLVVATPGQGGFEGTLESSPDARPDTVQGHYMAPNGRVAFVRFSAGAPIQVFVGSVIARSALDHRLSGDFYPLNAGAGGHPDSGAFPFKAGRLPVYKLLFDGVEDGCLGIRTVAGPLTLDTCADSPTQLFAIEERPALPGSTTPRMAILAHESGACLGTDPPALGQRVGYAPCRYTEFWTFERGIPRIATPDLVSLVNTGNLCLGVDLLRPEPLRYAWLQLCRAHPDPLWKLERQSY